jgi:uracil-DNA glycosylase family 4
VDPAVRCVSFPCTTRNVVSPPRLPFPLCLPCLRLPLPLPCPGGFSLPSLLLSRREPGGWRHTSVYTRNLVVENFRPMWHEKPAGCVGCPLEHRGLSFVPPSGPPSARLAIVGQGPGEQEAATGKPFFEQAPAGSILTRWLHRAGIQRSSVWVGNIIQCWLPKGRRDGRWFGSIDPPRKAVAHCWRVHVGPALSSLPELQIVVPVGAPARKFLMGDKFGERYCGTFTQGELPNL